MIVGHVDGYHGSGIFYELNKLKRGDQVLVARQDGSTARFSAYATEQVDKQNFPTDQVYATTTRAELRLIICGGIFNFGTGSYSDNVIVFAALAAGADPSHPPWGRRGAAPPGGSATCRHANPMSRRASSTFRSQMVGRVLGS